MINPKAMENAVKHEQNYPFTFTCNEWCKSRWLAQRGLERGISETGFSYFGARYYDSDLSGLFLSVDPMADKYPSISPYAYCAWNPVKLVDPNGEDGVCVVNGKSLTVIVVINYSQEEMNKYLKQIDYNHPNAFINDFANYYQSANGIYNIDGDSY